MKHLYFVRHGLSEANKAGVWSGQSHTPLSDDGRAQARLAGQAAKSLGIDCIVASPFERTLETAQIIAAEIGYPADKIITSELLIERGLGELEGQPWQQHPSIDHVPGVESQAELFARTSEAYDLIKSLEATNILVVGHGASGRALRHIVDPEEPFQGEHVKRFPNATIVQLL